MEITIRKLQPTESEVYRRVRLECLAEFPESFGSSYEEESELAKLSFERIIETQTKTAFMLGAFDGKKLIGICGFVQESRAKTKHQGELRQVYVSPAYAGRGIGRLLVQKAIKEGFNNAEIEQISLGVIAGNAAANSLYASLGFEEYGFLRNHLKVNDRYFHQRFMVLNRAAARNESHS